MEFFIAVVVTALVWYFARRDLDAHAVEARAPMMVEMQNLRATIEDLTSQLEQRATEIEQKVAAAEQRINNAERRIESKSAAIHAVPAALRKVRRDSESTPIPEPAPVPQEPLVSVAPQPTNVDNDVPMEDRYSQVSDLLAIGVTDSTEIARRTGLTRGEVELILGLRARHVL